MLSSTTGYREVLAMGWLSEQVHLGGDSSHTDWKPVFIALTEKDMLLYVAAPWSRDDWSSPVMSHPLLATRWGNVPVWFQNIIVSIITITIIVIVVIITFPGQCDFFPFIPVPHHLVHVSTVFIQSCLFTTSAALANSSQCKYSLFCILSKINCLDLQRVWSCSFTCFTAWHGRVLKSN